MKEKNQAEVQKEDITLNAYDHYGITPDLEVRYKGKSLSIIEGITLNAVIDERTNPSEGLQQLRQDIKKYYPKPKKETKQEKIILIYVCPMCGYKYHTTEQAMNCCGGKE